MTSRVWFIAECLDCTPILPMPFSDYEERAQWVGAHRVGTGHRVTMRIEVAKS